MHLDEARGLIGARVRYQSWVAQYSDDEGIITRVTERFVFVRYHRKASVSLATSADQLTLIGIHLIQEQP